MAGDLSERLGVTQRVQHVRRDEVLDEREHVGKLCRGLAAGHPEGGKIQVEFSWPSNAMPVGLPGTGPISTIRSVSTSGGSRSSWLA